MGGGYIQPPIFLSSRRLCEAIKQMRFQWTTKVQLLTHQMQRRWHHVPDQTLVSEICQSAFLQPLFCTSLHLPVFLTKYQTKSIYKITVFTTPVLLFVIT